MVLSHGISIKKIPKFILIFIRYLVLEPFRLIELYAYRNMILKHQLSSDPIFIIGHWRSGTSYLQDVLSKDPNLTTNSLYSFIFSDNSLITEFWLKPLLNALIKLLRVNYAFQRRKLDLNLVGEMDPGLCASMSSFSYTWGHIFPRQFNTYMNRFVYDLNQEDEQLWLADLDYHIKKLSFKNPGKTVVIKSPGNTARIPSLLAKYPQAKFIYIHRNPYEVYKSSHYLWNSILRQNSLQTLTQSQVGENIVRNYEILLQKYLADRHLLPESQLSEVTLKTLQNRPGDVLRQIYNDLDLGAPQIMHSLDDQSKHENYQQVSHSISQDDKSKLDLQWKFSMEIWPGE